MSSTPKSAKGSSWLLCEKCKTNVINKDLERHKTDCPPTLETFSYSFISSEGVLYSCVDIKTNEDIKSLSQSEKDNMVFLSQSAIQLCKLSFGDWAIIKPLHESFSPVVRTVWPTVDKSSTCVLFTKNGLNVAFPRQNINVSVGQLKYPIRKASRIYLVVLNGSKVLDLSPEIVNRIHKSYLQKILIQGNRMSIMYYGKSLLFEVKLIEPDENDNLEDSLKELSLNDQYTSCFEVCEKTSWKLFKTDSDCIKSIKDTDPFSKVGGLQQETEEIRELMYASLGKSHMIPGFKIGRSVLLYGSSGTGKSLLTQSLQKEAKVHVISISPTDLYTKYSGTAEDTIQKLFQEAVDRSPSLLILDEIDVLCPARTSRLTDTEKRVVSSLLASLDNLNDTEDCKVFIIAITNKIDSLDPSFRRCGRLDREIEIPVPNPTARIDILKRMLKDTPHSLNEDELREIAGKTHGFVGADLVSLCSHAVLHASKRFQAHNKLGLDDLLFAMSRVRPSAMREVQIEVPNVKWSDIGGQEDLKLILRQAVEWPLKYADSFQRLGITPPRGVLMFGPPGCSKTMIAKALATESGLNFLSIKGPELFSKWVGESERAVREVFRKARQVAPSIIFFDEIDALGGERSSGSSTSVQERVLAQLLTELDGVTPLGDVTVLAATNRPDRIDRALLRPGRLDRIVYVPLPDEKTREDIFRIKLEKMPILDVDVDLLIQLTEGYSGAEVNAVCHEAAMKALEETLDAKHVTQKHFLSALKLVTPRTSPFLLKIYDDYVNNVHRHFDK